MPGAAGPENRQAVRSERACSWAGPERLLSCSTAISSGPAAPLTVPHTTRRSIPCRGTRDVKYSRTQNVKCNHGRHGKHGNTREESYDHTRNEKCVHTPTVDRLDTLPKLVIQEENEVSWLQTTRQLVAW